MKDSWPQQCRLAVHRAERPMHVLAVFVMALGAILYALGDAPVAWQRITGQEHPPEVVCIAEGRQPSTTPKP